MPRLRRGETIALIQEPSARFFFLRISSQLSAPAAVADRETDVA